MEHILSFPQRIVKPKMILCKGRITSAYLFFKANLQNNHSQNQLNKKNRHRLPFLFALFLYYKFRDTSPVLEIFNIMRAMFKGFNSYRQTQFLTIHPDMYIF